MTTIIALWLLIFFVALYYVLFDAEEGTRGNTTFRRLRRYRLRTKKGALNLVNSIQRYLGAIQQSFSSFQQYWIRQSAPDHSARSAYWYLALFVPVLACVSLANWRFNAIVNDTLLLFSSLEMTKRFSSLFSNENANPLQALFDIMPSGLRHGALPTLFGTGIQTEFFYILCGTLLAFATAAMGRAAELRWSVAVSAGIAVPLLLLPTFGLFPLAEHFYLLWPTTYYAAAGTLAVTAMLWQINGHSWRRAALLIAAIIAILIHLSITQILFMTLLAPAFVAMGAGALAAANDRKSLLARIACAVAIVVAMAAAGIFHYMYAVGVSTATYVFYDELPIYMMFGPPSIANIIDDVSYVFANPFTYNFFGLANIDGALIPLAQLGAIYLAFLGKTRAARVYGWSVIGLVAGTIGAIILFHNFHYYTGVRFQGPDPRHFTPIFWPYYLLCVASLILALADQATKLLSRALRKFNISKYPSHALTILLLAGPIIIVVVNQFRSAPFHWHPTGLPFFHDFKRNPVVDLLEREIGVAIDRDFRGTAVSIPTEFDKNTKPYHASRRETTFAYARAYLGNDFGAFGLKHFNIPTIDQMTHNVTPQFYLTVRELLSRPSVDQYDRHFALVTRLNEPIMALLGLRYIIADYTLPFGTERLAMPIPEEARKILEAAQLYKSPIRVYELADPNLGNYSPTELIRTNMAADAIAAMAKPAFNGRQTFTTDDAAIGDNLVAATDAKMTVRLGGVAVSASSTGQSVLVLPVQYSHCWRIVSGDGATLFRANLMQLGIRFTGRLNVELRQIFGPFWQSACRVKDAEDAVRLRMADARGSGGWKAP